MKHLPIIIACIISTILLSCNNSPSAPEYDTHYWDSISQTTAKGADLGWLSEMESDGIVFYNSNHEATDCLELLKSIGMNSVRFRVWVNPSKTGGWCDKADVIRQSVRAQKLGLRVMIDFHYSDYFADPSKQEKPAEWANYSFDQLKEAIANHTTDVLQGLKDNGVNVEWIQIGNETRNGMLWPDGQLWDNNGDIPNGWNNLAQLCNSGYDAAKSVFPDAKVGVHVDNAYENRVWWWSKFKAAGGKFDIIYLSHYPQTNNTLSWEEMNSLCASNSQTLARQFGCHFMISEVGTKSNNATLAASVMQDFKKKVLSQSLCDGAFYWEPEVYGGWKPTIYNTLGWGAYDMGAFTTLGQPNEALKILYE